MSKRIEFYANIAPVPANDFFEISDDSIVIEDGGASFLIGRDAELSSNGGRQLGGGIGHPYYRRLLKATLAGLLGEGKHKYSIAFSAAHHMISEFRGPDSGVNLSSDIEAILKSTLSSIKFKKGDWKSDWKECSVDIQGEPKAYYEYQATLFSLPMPISTGLVWQTGYGDFQQILMLRGRPVPETICRTEGIIGAIKIFAESLGLSTDRAIIAWESEEIVGLSGTIRNLKEAKKSALTYWASSNIAKLTSLYAPFAKEFDVAIVSGGPIKDATVWEVLIGELNRNGISFYPISELPEQLAGNHEAIDPSFSAVEGLLTRAELAVDIGNGRLKAGVSK